MDGRAGGAGRGARAPLVCFSHLRWDFVWQRPQQLMTRFARDRRVYFVEEPVYAAGAGVAHRAGAPARTPAGATAIGVAGG